MPKKMRNRLLQKIRQAKVGRSKLFCAFLTLGYPSLVSTKQLIQKFEASGVDIVELGFPFSDPLADGPTIQYSSERALAKGVRMRDAFRLTRQLRREGSRIPLIFFSYLNPIYHYGYRRFVRDATQSGFDGLIIPDLPPDAEHELQVLCRHQGLAQIFFIAPTTTSRRAVMIGKRSQGFIYYVSLRGVTGARRALPSDIHKSVSRLQRRVKKPFLVGFGISTTQQARKSSRGSQGVIVGSAVIDRLRRSKGSIRSAVRYIQTMARGVHRG